MNQETQNTISDAELVEKMAVALSSMVHHASVMINDNHPAMKNAKSLLSIIDKRHTQIPNAHS